jgi:hypothetical protein
MNLNTISLPSLVGKANKVRRVIDPTKVIHGACENNLSLRNNNVNRLFVMQNFNSQSHFGFSI